MVTSVEYVDAVRRQQRAARHTVSLTLGVHGVAIAYLAATTLIPWWSPGWWPGSDLLVPAATYLLLWLLVVVRRRVSGIGAGGEGFGIMAIGCLLFVVVFPLGSAAVWLLGPGTLLGVCMAIVGARLHEPRLWGPAIGLMVLCPLVGLYTFDNMFYDSSRLEPGTVILAVLAAALLSLAGVAYRAERAATSATPV